MLPAFSFGRYGPHLFYAVSALTLFISLSISSSGFFVRRFFRIAPLFYFSIIIYSVFDVDTSNAFNSDLFRQEPASPWAYISNLFFLHSLHYDWINAIVPGSWSIGIEFFFYLFTPFLFKKVNTLSRGVIFLFFAALIQKNLYSSIGNTLGIQPSPNWTLYSYCYLGNNLPYFAVGIILYFLIFKQERPRALDLIIFFLTYVLFRSDALNIAYLLLLGILATFSLSSKYPQIVTRPLIFYGKISYSLYLTNFIGIRLVDYFIKNIYFVQLTYLNSLVICFLIVTVISYATFHLIESPFIKLGASIIKWKVKA